MMNKVVIVGSYNVDLTFKTQRLPRSGETVIGETVTIGHGGKGANQAVAAARAGGDVCFIASVGADSYGEKAIADLQQEGINTDYIKIDQTAPTGMASITVDQHGENCIVAVSGANANLWPDDINKLEKVIAAAGTLLIQLESPLETVKTAVKIAHAHGVRVILNPAPAQQLDPRLLSMVSIITPNKVEAQMLTGIPISDEQSLQQTASVFRSFGIPLSLITLGARGVYVTANGSSELIPSYPVVALDTTGAGDVFNGVLAANLSAATDLHKAIALATSAASLSVTRIGSQTAIPLLSEINSFLITHS